MKAWRILLLIVALFASATAEWSKIDCSDKDAVKAIYEAEQYIKNLMQQGVTYYVDHSLKCMHDTSVDKDLYGLSLYGKDTTRTAYVHNVVVSKDMSGDFHVESKQLISTKTAAELSSYPYQNILF